MADNMFETYYVMELKGIPKMSAVAYTKAKLDGASQDKLEEVRVCFLCK
jgi:hypothetical protein